MHDVTSAVIGNLGQGGNVGEAEVGVAAYLYRWHVEREEEGKGPSCGKRFECPVSQKPPPI